MTVGKWRTKIAFSFVDSTDSKAGAPRKEERRFAAKSEYAPIFADEAFQSMLMHRTI
jgi:hypothetical protein